MAKELKKLKKLVVSTKLRHHVAKGGRDVLVAYWVCEQTSRSGLICARDEDVASTLRDDVLYHMSVHVCQSAIDAVVADGELFVVDAEEVHRGGVEVVAVDGVGRGFVGPDVAFAVGGAAFDAATGHPGSERGGVVIAARAPLAARHAAELGGPDDEGVVEHTARFEILQ